MPRERPESPEGDLENRGRRVDDMVSAVRRDGRGETTQPELSEREVKLQRLEEQLRQLQGPELTKALAAMERSGLGEKETNERRGNVEEIFQARAEELRQQIEDLRAEPEE